MAHRPKLAHQRVQILIAIFQKKSGCYSEFAQWVSKTWKLLSGIILAEMSSHAAQEAQEQGGRKELLATPEEPNITY